MSLLLDTHVFLWYLAADPRLSAAWVSDIRSPVNRVFVSVAVVWEATIKYEAGKLSLPDHPAVYLPTGRVRQRFDSLGIDEDTAFTLRGLPPIHRDPFDHIMVAQAIQHNMTMATVDAQVRAYPVALLPLTP
jgi:PIN domain nuclease of toxin-antitoxin system